MIKMQDTIDDINEILGITLNRKVKLELFELKYHHLKIRVGESKTELQNLKLQIDRGHSQLRNLNREIAIVMDHLNGLRTELYYQERKMTPQDQG